LTLTVHGAAASAAARRPKNESFKRQMSRRLRREWRQGLGRGHPPGRAWTDAEVARLGTDTDESIARELERSATVRDVARELRLDWKTVKALQMEYMREQLRRAGTPGPKLIGIDELSIGRGHNYRIIVSDLAPRRPIWFGGTDRSEKSMDLFFQ
jgi:hypothetical protein